MNKKSIIDVDGCLPITTSGWCERPGQGNGIFKHLCLDHLFIWCRCAKSDNMHTSLPYVGLSTFFRGRLWFAMIILLSLVLGKKVVSVFVKRIWYVCVCETHMVSPVLPLRIFPTLPSSNNNRTLIPTQLTYNLRTMSPQELTRTVCSPHCSIILILH